MIDTACGYRNHKAVGKGIKKCIDEGVIKREELFLTTKLWISDWRPDDVEKAIQTSLEDLQLDYIDLLLIHHAPFFNLKPEDDERRQKGYFFDYNRWVDDDPKCRIGYSLDNVKITWKKLEELVGRGLIRSIGLSNFSSKKLLEVIPTCTIRPAVLQVELHPYLQQWELKKVCDEYNIYLTAWYPLGGQPENEEDKKNKPLCDKVIEEIAKAHNKTPAQIVIRWAIQRNTICIPKSVHEERIKENFEVFDFELTEEEMNKIRALDRHHRFGRPNFFLPSPHTWKDLWDGECIDD